MDDNARLQAIELALSQAKRVQRESRHVVQSLARLRDDFQETPTANEAQGNGRTEEKQD